MGKLWAFGMAFALVMLTGAEPVFAQKATERFIPIGRSPGLSGVYSNIGRIDAIEKQRKLMFVRGDKGFWSCRVTKDTRIWIVRSGQDALSEVGTFEDLSRGLRVEVKYKDDKRRENAEWIKVAPNRRDQTAVRISVPLAATTAEAHCKRSVTVTSQKKISCWSACRAAIRDWSLKTSGRYGSEWANWDNARRKRIDCKRLRGPLEYCVAKGTPCGPHARR